jgi:hypothetical protein
MQRQASALRSSFQMVLSKSPFRNELTHQTKRKGSKTAWAWYEEAGGQASCNYERQLSLLLRTSTSYLKAVYTYNKAIVKVEMMVVGEFCPQGALAQALGSHWEPTCSGLPRKIHGQVVCCMHIFHYKFSFPLSYLAAATSYPQN